MEKILAVITARGGSKGLPGKNIKELNGRPLISYTIERSAALKDILYDVIVSTDDKNIASVSAQYGASVPFIRPKYLATDESTSLDVVRHAIEFVEKKDNIKIDWLLILQPTTPLRTKNDIRKAVGLIKNKNVDTVVSVCKAEHTHPLKMKKINNGFLYLYMNEASWEVRKQDLSPSAYMTNGGIYLTKRDVIMNGDLVGEFVKPYIMPENRSIDIDNELDFLMAEVLMKKQVEEGYE